MRHTFSAFCLALAATLSLTACGNSTNTQGKSQHAAKEADAVDAKLTNKSATRGGPADDTTTTTDPTNTGKGDQTVDDTTNTGKGDTTQTPTQTPTQTTPPGKDPGTPVVVDVPKVPCVYLDPDKPDFTIAKNQFGPNLPPVAVPSSIIKGEVEADGQTFIGAFTIFQIITAQGAIDAYEMVWDGKTAAIPFDYAMVVTQSADSSCKAYLRFVRQEVRLPNGGCFSQDTKLRMADGTDQVIALLSRGDLVWNPLTRKAARVAEVIKGPEAKPMYEIGFGAKHMVVTDKHPVPVRGGLKQAKDVTTADYVYDDNGIIQRVTTAKALPVNPKQIVVNVRLEGASSAASEHMIVAGGMLSGDLFLQRQLAGQRELTAKK